MPPGKSARGLAYHRTVARRLRRPMVEEARHTLFSLRQSGLIAARYADRWEEILGRTVPEIRRALVEETQEADDLRQNSPFAGTLSEPERRRIIESVRWREARGLRARIAAAANLTGEDEFVVIGSQAVLGSFPAAPDTMLRSMEADVYPLHRPEKADEIDGNLGDGSISMPSSGSTRMGSDLVSGDELLKRAADLPLDPQTLDYVLGILLAIVEAEAGGRR
jgi:hypothetical protein